MSSGRGGKRTGAGRPSNAIVPEDDVAKPRTIYCSEYELKRLKEHLAGMRERYHFIKQNGDYSFFR